MNASFHMINIILSLHWLLLTKLFHPFLFNKRVALIQYKAWITKLYIELSHRKTFS